VHLFRKEEMVPDTCKKWGKRGVPSFERERKKKVPVKYRPVEGGKESNFALRWKEGRPR